MKDTPTAVRPTGEIEFRSATGGVLLCSVRRFGVLDVSTIEVGAARLGAEQARMLIAWLGRAIERVEAEAKANPELARLAGSDG